jgi:hypothetical protein
MEGVLIIFSINFGNNLELAMRSPITEYASRAIFGFSYLKYKILYNPNERNDYGQLGKCEDYQ